MLLQGRRRTSGARPRLICCVPTMAGSPTACPGNRISGSMAAVLWMGMMPMMVLMNALKLALVSKVYIVQHVRISDMERFNSRAMASLMP